MLRVLLYQIGGGIISTDQIGYDGPQSISLQAALNTVVYPLAGTVAVLIIVIAGFMFVTANGDAGRVQKAKMAILGAVIGLVVIVFAFVITQFVIFKVA